MRFIVITGTPGVGKTIASKILAKNLGVAYIDLNKMVLDEKLDVGYDRERKCFIADFEKISKKGIFRAFLRESWGFFYINTPAQL